MRNILKFVRTEFLVQLYTPVSWFIILVFLIQTGTLFCEGVSQVITSQLLKQNTNNIIHILFAAPSTGIFVKVQSYLYLYIPLLTMSIFSKEFSSGSIKLLYSSPVSTAVVVMSKFLSLVLVGGILMLILLGYMVVASLITVMPNMAAAFAGWLGIFLLLISYIAIGLFMSSLTSYSVVAALGTLIVFAVLNLIGTFWQDVPIVQDICYWLVLKGRADTFISGMITTEDLIYFLLVPAMFLLFTYIRLRSQMRNTSLFTKIASYAGVFLLVGFLGFLTSLPGLKKYYDLTYSKANTLSVESQQAMKGLDKKLTIHTYVNMLYQGFLILPIAYKTDQKRLEQYIRFKPDMEIKYHYYYKLPSNSNYPARYPGLNVDQIYDTLQLINNWNVPIQPLSELQHNAILTEEDYAFLRVLEYEDGQTIVVRNYRDLIRVPKELEISTGFKGLQDPPVKVGVFQKNGERSIISDKKEGIRSILNETTARTSLVNLGFTCYELDPDQEVPDSIKILLIAAPTVPYSTSTFNHIEKFYERGGNLACFIEPGAATGMNPFLSKYGVQMIDTTLQQTHTKLMDDELLVFPVKLQHSISHYFSAMVHNRIGVITPGASSLQIIDTSNYTVKALLHFNDSNGKGIPIAVGINKPSDTIGSRMVVMTDIDWMNNDEIMKQRADVFASNRIFSKSVFHWLSGNRYPIEINRPFPIDNEVKISGIQWKPYRSLLMYVLPVLVFICFLWLFYSRSRR